ncbi:MAG: Mov34/MPN/PAD-1 family protein [Chloroflexota bacterium]|jgi:integrative and conjugative element protein (TIGR02256 family)
MEFRSDDRRYGLRLPDTEIAKLLKECQAVGENETGGIISGYYTEDLRWAVVTAISAPPIDSSSSKTWFLRGTLGLQKWIDRIWVQRRWYYLGEWHFHPRHAPIPSSDDDDQMRRLARSLLLMCPEPLLVIIGGNPNEKWEVGAYVYPRNSVRRELKRVGSVS